MVQHKYTVAQINDWFSLGLGGAAVLEMDDLGIFAQTNSSGTKLSFGSVEHAVVTDMPIKAGTIKMAQEGLLPFGVMSPISKQIKGALSICVTQLGNKAPVWSDADTNAMNESLKAESESLGHFDEDKNFPAEPNSEDDLEEADSAPVYISVADAKSKVWEFVESNEKVKAIKGLRILTGLGLKGAKAHVDAWFDEHDAAMMTHDDEIEDQETLKSTAFDKAVHGESIEDVLPPLTQFSVKEALKMHKVKLINATMMYQPVNGTSSASTYHCIGLVDGHNLKFAARWTQKNLSIRVEGPVEKHSIDLIAAGFNEAYIENGYTSVHFNGIDELTARRCIGAVLAGTGFKFLTAMPDIDVIGQVGT